SDRAGSCAPRRRGAPRRPPPPSRWGRAPDGPPRRAPAPGSPRSRAGAARRAGAPRGSPSADHDTVPRPAPDPPGSSGPRGLASSARSARGPCAPRPRTAPPRPPPPRPPGRTPTARGLPRDAARASSSSAPRARSRSRRKTGRRARVSRGFRGGALGDQLHQLRLRDDLGPELLRGGDLALAHLLPGDEVVGPLLDLVVDGAARGADVRVDVLALAAQHPGDAEGLAEQAPRLHRRGGGRRARRAARLELAQHRAGERIREEGAQAVHHLRAEARDVTRPLRGLLR